MSGSAIDKCDSINGVIIFTTYGAGRIVKRTIDAGNTWEDIYVDTLDPRLGGRILPAYDISYPTKDFIIFTCNSNTYIKTTDAGKNWKESIILHSTNYNSKKINHVKMLNSKYGIMTKAYYLYYSNDGFETYQTIIPGEYKYYISKACLIDSNTIYAVAINIKEDRDTDTIVKFMKSFDRGKTWSFTPIKGLSYPEDFDFVDNLNGFITGGKSISNDDRTSCQVLNTTDGGNTWQTSLFDIPEVPFGLQSLDFIDKKTLIAVGQHGNVYWKFENYNWVLDKDPMTFKFSPFGLHVALFNRTNAVIIDNFGRTIRSYLPTNVNEQLNTNFGISPNPASDYIEINVGAHCNVPLQEGIEIFNIFGENTTPPNLSGLPPLLAKEGIIKIDISNLPVGVYFIKIGDKFEKFVKM
jgi:hypothetical protein